MELIVGYKYHIFNRGNNGEKIFYSDSNYEFFFEKLKDQILPYCDFLAWCLMPNHFHLMIEVIHEKIGNKTINQAIGRLLCSYARAINIQEKRTGSLFQKHTKACCLNKIEKLSPSWFKIMGVNNIFRDLPQKEYSSLCFEYIHNNPERAGLVFDRKYWPYSSYREIFLGSKEYSIVNFEKVKKIVPRL